MDTRVVAIISAFNEEDIIAQVIADLIRQRVSVYVLDNRSTDRTRTEVAQFVGRGVIACERFPSDSDNRPGAYEWERILERKADLAQELDADWFIHHDADEFREGPWADVDLAASIARVERFGYNAIDFELLNFWPTHDNFKPGDDVREAFVHHEAARERDKIQIRCWKRTTGRVDLVSSGGHEAIFAGRKVFPLRFLLRHYPIRGQAHGLRKVFEERRPRFIDSERGRGWHVQYEQCEPNQTFLRDPASLIQYDADLVRLNLVLRHRDVEALDCLPGAERRLLEQQQRYEARVERDMDRLNHEVARLERESVGCAERVAELEKDADGRNRRAIVLESALDAAQNAVNALECRLEMRNREIEAAHRTAHERNLSIELLERQRDEGNLSIESLARALDRRNLSIEALERQLDQRNLSIESLERQLDQHNLSIESLERQLDERNRELLRVETELSRISEALTEQRASLESIRSSWPWRWLHRFR
jgi:hypothetical protein